jgi:hypothetical protein
MTQDLKARIMKWAEFEKCEISKTNNQYKHGRIAENKRLMELIDRLGAIAWASQDRVGPWISAALEDKSVCEEMKADIHILFTAHDKLERLLGGGEGKT